MGVFCIMRKQFLDRAFDIDELNEFVNMLRLWYIQVAGRSSQRGHLQIEARVYAYPTQLGEPIRQSLSHRLPGVTFDASDPDELRVAAPATPAGEEPDLSVWREVLAEPLLR